MSGGTRPGSTQHSASVEATIDSTGRSRRCLASMGPSTGAVESANTAVTRGSGRTGWNGSAGSISIRPATVCGAAFASSRTIMPPIELPIRMAGQLATASTNLCSSARLDETSARRAPDSVRPKPARSGATTRYLSVSSGAIADQFTADPPRPCTATTSGAPAGPPKSR